jgi:hypothetical protein
LLIAQRSLLYSDLKGETLSTKNEYEQTLFKLDEKITKFSDTEKAKQEKSKKFKEAKFAQGMMIAFLAIGLILHLPIISNLYQHSLIAKMVISGISLTVDGVNLFCLIKMLKQGFSDNANAKKQALGKEAEKKASVEYAYLILVSLAAATIGLDMFLNGNMLLGNSFSVTPNIIGQSATTMLGHYILPAFLSLVMGPYLINGIKGRKFIKRLIEKLDSKDSPEEYKQFLKDIVKLDEISDESIDEIFKRERREIVDKTKRRSKDQIIIDEVKRSLEILDMTLGYELSAEVMRTYSKILDKEKIDVAELQEQITKLTYSNV